MNTLQTAPILSNEIFALLEESISGERCKEHVTQISRFDRIQASEGWLDAARYVQDILKKAGFQNVLLEKFPSNGEIKYYTWTPPMGWKGEYGELWMVEPSKKKLADFNEVANSLAKGSRSSDVTAEVVYVGAGEDEKDYSGKNIKGKIVLANGYAGKVHREAVLKRGAAGVVTFIGKESHMEYPDLVPYQGLWLRRKENEKATFGFTISRRNAERILSLLDNKKKVVLHARVRGDNYDSEVGMMSVTIPGMKKDEEVLLLAHLDHYKPGANDNASGSAAILEIACALKKLVQSGKLSQPRRTLRFLWTTEWFGIVPWVQKNIDVLNKTLAAINFDMVGNDLVKTNSYFYLTKTPDSLPSFVNDLIENMTEHVARKNILSPTGSRYPFHYKVHNFLGGSDHWILCDATVGVPAVMLGHQDPYHHTAQDSPDHIDPSEMKRVSLIGAASASFIAWCQEADAMNLANLIFSKGMARIAANALCVEDKEQEKKLKKIKDRKNADLLHRDKIHKLQHTMKLEQETLKSILNLSRSLKTKNYIKSLIDQSSSLSDFYRGLLINSLESHGIKAATLIKAERSKKEQEAERVIPTRTSLYITPLARGYLKEALKGRKEFENLKINPESDIGWEICNFADGKRNLLEIRNAVSAEYYPLSLEDIERMLSLLERASLISFHGK